MAAPRNEEVDELKHRRGYRKVEIVTAENLPSVGSDHREFGFLDFRYFVER